jgi:hypothetical protein
MVQRHRSVNDEFGKLIRDQNNRHPAKNEFGFYTQAATPDLRTSAQRRQTVG